MGRVLAASAPKWATVLSGSRKSLPVMTVTCAGTQLYTRHGSPSAN
jgi:hypothetical protein